MCDGNRRECDHSQDHGSAGPGQQRPIQPGGATSSNLAHYFRSQAEWRDAKTDQYPEDERNSPSAAALRSSVAALLSLADYVEPIDSREAESPSGDRYLSHVSEIELHLHEGTLGGKRVASYGYGRRVGSQEQFLEELLLLCYEDAYDHAAEHHEDRTGALHPFEVAAARNGVHLPQGYWRRRDHATVAELERWVSEARPGHPDSAEGEGGA